MPTPETGAATTNLHEASSNLGSPSALSPSLLSSRESPTSSPLVYIPDGTNSPTFSDEGIKCTPVVQPTEDCFSEEDEDILVFFSLCSRPDADEMDWVGIWKQEEDPTNSNSDRKTSSKPDAWVRTCGTQESCYPSRLQVESGRLRFRVDNLKRDKDYVAHMFRSKEEDEKDPAQAQLSSMLAKSGQSFKIRKNCRKE